MKGPPARPPVLCLLGLLAVGTALGSCGSGKIIEVSVLGLQNGVRSLQVGAQVPGQPNWLAQPVGGRLDSFRVQLPAGVAGPLVLQIAGLDAGQCTIAQGSATGTVDQAERLGMQVQLAPQDRGCKLTVERSGDGQGLVTSADGQIRCGTACEAFYPPGTRVMLAAQALSSSADDTTYFAGWSGMTCQGRGPCEAVTGDRPEKVIAGFLPRRVCGTGQGRFCWENPLPQGNRLYGMWAGLGPPVWAVGAGGTVLQWNGAIWSPFHTQTQESLYAVWGYSPDDVWTVGSHGTALHWDGVAWSPPVPTGTTGDLVALWGSARDDVWAVGGTGHVMDVVVHFDGSVWSPVPTGIGNDISAVWGSARDDVWLSSESGLFHFDGKTYRAVTLPGTDFVPSALWGTAQNDVWLAGLKFPFQASVLHYDGTTWTEKDSGLSSLGHLYGVWSTGPRDAWTAGAGGAIAHYDGTAWASVNSGTRSLLRGVRGTAGDDIWAVGDAGTAVRWNGAFWVPVSGGTSSLLSALWGSGGTDIWAVGEGGTILHFDGNSWVPYPDRSGDSLHGVWGSDPDNVWAVGDRGRLLLWTRLENGGSYWNDLYQSGTTEPLYGVWGNRPDNFWAVGGSTGPGVILHGAGTRWTQVPGPAPARLNAVWGVGSQVWAVGASGQVLYSSNGAGFSAMKSGTGTDLYGIWGSASDDVWAVGGATAIHFDGKAWSQSAVPAGVDLQALWGSRKDDVWAVDSGGVVLHFDGTAWSRGDQATNNGLHGVWGSGAGEFWVGGEGGAIVHYRPLAGGGP